MDTVIKVPNKNSCPMPSAVIFKPCPSGRPKLPKFNPSYLINDSKPSAAPVQEQSESVPKPNTVNYNISCVQTLGLKPSTVICPSCNNKVVTRIKYKPHMKTHFLAALLCLSFFFCIAPLPYMLKSCKSVEHYCPLCKAYVGSY